MKNYAKPFYKAQERFRDNWLSKKPEYPELTRCMWQETAGVKDTNIKAIECWQVGKDLYIVELLSEGNFIVFKEEK